MANTHMHSDKIKLRRFARIFILPVMEVVIHQKNNTQMDIKIGKVPEDIEIEKMYVSPVEVESDEGDSIIEDNLHLEVRNIGRKTISFLDCKIKYLGRSGKEIGSDSDGTFDLIKTNEMYEISVPFFTPPDTMEHKLDITIQYKNSLMQNLFMLWMLCVSIYGIFKLFNE